MGWLKCREFGRHGRTACDQVIQVQTRNSNVRRLRHPVGSELQSRSLPTLCEEWRAGKKKNVTHQTSDQKRLPAEFKHITKRRRRN